MAKFTEKERQLKKEQAKDLYARKYSVETISEMIGISVVTLNKWSKADNWDTYRKASDISISQMTRTIWESFQETREGKKPKISADQAIKYANALEKLSDSKKYLPVMFESFDMLCDEINHRLNMATNKKDKESYLNLLKAIRPITQDILERTAKEQFSIN